MVVVVAPGAQFALVYMVAGAAVHLYVVAAAVARDVAQALSQLAAADSFPNELVCAAPFAAMVIDEVFADADGDAVPADLIDPVALFAEEAVFQVDRVCIGYQEYPHYFA